MRIFRGALPALALALTLVPGSAQAQDPLQELRRYDYQDRKALDAIRKQIMAAGKDTAKLAALETGLVAVLSDTQATEGAKLEACTFLCQIGTARSVPAVAKLLANPATANAARLALERNTDPSAGVALLAALNTATGSALVGTINSLGNREEVLAVGKLKGLTASTDALVAVAAVNALGKIATPASIAALRGVKNPALPTAPALLNVAGKLVASGKRSEAQGVYESLLRANQPEVIRAGALTGLVAVGAPKRGELALGLAKTAPEPTLQRVAGRVLGMQPESTKLALGAFATLPAPAQIALLAAWSDRKEMAAAPIALEALKSSDPEVRVAAIQTAARVAGVPAVLPLATLAQEGAQASVARTALARMGGAGVEEALLRLASSGSGKIPPTVIGVLGERPTPRSTTQLMTIASTKDQETRVAVAALKALEKTATATQLEALARLLVSTSDELIRDASQSTLMAIAQRSGERDRAAQPLVSAMGGASVASQAAILGTLAELGGSQALGALTQAVNSPNATLKNAALAGLANSWNDSGALPILLPLAKKSSEKEERVLALRGSLRILSSDDKMPEGQKLTQLTELFELAERPEEKRQALSVLREVRLPGAVVLAAKALDSAELVAEAADAILYLVASHKQGRRTTPAVTGAEVKAALDKLIATSTDEKIKAEAQKLRRQK